MACKTKKKLENGGTIGTGIGSAIGGIAGSFIGPIGTMGGAAIGGALGGAVGGMIDNQRKPMLYPNTYQINQQTMNQMTGNNPYGNSMMYAMGGSLNGMTQYKGNIHENGGIPLGNTGNEVEDGEVRMGEYIFSNRITPTQSNQTYAQIAKSIQDKYSKRKNDSISKESMMRELAQLAQSQEAIKQNQQVATQGRLNLDQEGMVEQQSEQMNQQFAQGGPLNSWLNLFRKDKESFGTQSKQEARDIRRQKRLDNEYQQDMKTKGKSNILPRKLIKDNEGFLVDASTLYRNNSPEITPTNTGSDFDVNGNPKYRMDKATKKQIKQDMKLSKQYNKWAGENSPGIESLYQLEETINNNNFAGNPASIFVRENIDNFKKRGGVNALNLLNTSIHGYNYINHDMKQNNRIAPLLEDTPQDNMYLEGKKKYNSQLDKFGFGGSLRKYAIGGTIPPTSNNEQLPYNNYQNGMNPYLFGKPIEQPKIKQTYDFNTEIPEQQIDWNDNPFNTEIPEQQIDWNDNPFNTNLPKSNNPIINKDNNFKTWLSGLNIDLSKLKDIDLTKLKEKYNSVKSRLQSGSVAGDTTKMLTSSIGGLYDIARGVGGANYESYGRINPLQLRELDPNEIVKQTREMSLNAQNQMKNVGGQGLGQYLNNMNAVNAGASRNIGNIISQYDNANLGINNQQRQGNKEIQNLNIGLDIQQNDINARERDAASNDIQKGLTTLSEGYNQMYQDRENRKVQDMIMKNYLGTNDIAVIPGQGNNQMGLKRIGPDGITYLISSLDQDTVYDINGNQVGSVKAGYFEQKQTNNNQSNPFTRLERKCGGPLKRK